MRRQLGLVRCLQTCTAAAAVFAVLGACGITPLSRGPRVRPRPIRPRAEVTIRSLTGVWVAVRDAASGRQALALSLVQSGNTVSGALMFGSRSLHSDPAAPAGLGAAGEFRLIFGHSADTVVVEGRADLTGDRLLASVHGLEAHPVALIFTRP